MAYSRLKAYKNLTFCLCSLQAPTLKPLMHQKQSLTTEMSLATGHLPPQMRSQWVTPKEPQMDAKGVVGPEAVGGEEEVDTNVSNAVSEAIIAFLFKIHF